MRTLALLPVLFTLSLQAAQWHNEWSRGAVCYEIFVRSFADSDGDGIGDLKGLTAKLDYLTSLGVDAVWLTPIFQSPSYHGYDTTDYETIEKDFGTNDDFRAFVAAAHKRHIRVILDFVMNHTSNEHPWFIDSASSPKSKHRNWYVWSTANPGWKQPWGGDPSWHFLNGAYYYGAFWSGMPDLNWRNPEVKKEMFRLARYWLQQGADGYRLDATRYLVETGPGAGQADTRATHRVLREFADAVHDTKPDAMLIAENTTSIPAIASYFHDLPSSFNFPLAKAIVEGVKRGDASGIVSVMREDARVYPKGVIDAPFLTNHDQIRIATVLGNDPHKLRSAAAILLTLPGMPFLYYGEEVGMQNDPGEADEAKRRPMPWTMVAAETNDPQSLLSYYRTWIALRHQTPALRDGDLTPLDAPPGVLAYLRSDGKERVLVVHNLSDAAAEVPGVILRRADAEGPVCRARSTGPSPSARLRMTLLIHGDPGVTTSELPPHTSGLYRVVP